MEQFECDICGELGERYTIGFPDGFMALDRCDKHDGKIKALREEKGTWNTGAVPGKALFKVSTPEEIKRQQTKKQ